MYGGLGTGYEGGSGGYGGGVWRVRGAVGTVEGRGGYGGGVRWVRWRGMMGTVERYNSGYSGEVWVRCMGTVGTVDTKKEHDPGESAYHFRFQLTFPSRIIGRKRFVFFSHLSLAEWPGVDG